MFTFENLAAVILFVLYLVGGIGVLALISNALINEWERREKRARRLAPMKIRAMRRGRRHE